MSFVLCHECFSWVEPQDGCCPDCLDVLELGRPDPTPDQLQLTIGNITCLMGEIRIRRKLLPDTGMLYATTNGLYFIPHQPEHVTELVEASPMGSSILWSLAAIIWTPLMLVLPFVRLKQLTPRRVQLLHPQHLTPDDSNQLPLYLLENPGVFFVPLKSIQLVEQNWKSWTIHRIHGSAIKLKPVTDTRLFHNRMAELIGLNSWQHVMVNQ